MRYKTINIFLFIFIFSMIVLNCNATGLEDVDAISAILLDVETGQILYGKNIHLKRPPASLTKILTTIVALEEGDINDIVTISERAAYQEGSSIWLKRGEKIKLGELLFGVMLSSGNDASVAVAEHISGSLEKFSELMNKKARKIGARNSFFLNPSGLPQVGHYSTAYDLAVIMKYALQNKVFRKITSTKYITIPWEGHEWDRGLRNHNKMLWSYQDITGGKTGFTRAAGRCLISSAKKAFREVIAVVLNCSNDWYELRKLLDYGLNDFQRVDVLNQGDIIHTIKWEESREKKLNIKVNKSIKIVIPRGEKIKIKKKISFDSDLELPINKDEILGKLSIYHKGYKIKTVNISAANDLNYNSIFLRMVNKMKCWFEEIG